MNKHSAYKYFQLWFIFILVITLIGLTACSKPGAVSVPNQSQDTTQNITPQNNTQLQQIINLTHSPNYGKALTDLSQVEDQSNQLATFIEGLPQLPNLLNYVTLDDIQTAVDQAKYLRNKLSSLRPLPSLLPGFPLPPPPPPVKDAAQKLENMRQDILNVSEPIEQLPDLPSFLSQSDTLPNAKQDIDNHFHEVESISGDTTMALQHLKDLSGSPGGNLANVTSYVNSSEYQTLSDKLNQINTTNNQLITFVGSLPPLPTKLNNIPISKVNDAIKIAKEIYPILKALPPLPSVDPNIATLESIRVSAVTITGFINKLPNLPDFISGSQSLEQVRVKMLNYLSGVQSTISQDNAILQQVNQIVGGQPIAANNALQTNQGFTPNPAITPPPPPMTTTVVHPSITTSSVPTISTYSLSLSINPTGAGSISTSDGQYSAGTQVTITATPASNYVFDSWNGDASGSSNSIIVTMNSNKNIVANFRYIPPGPVTYNLNVSISSQGSGLVSLSPPGGQYNSGTVVTATAIPANGYTFASWSGDISGSSPTNTITMNSNTSVIATFIPIPAIKIQNVNIPTVVTVGQNCNYNVTLSNSSSSQANVTLDINSTATGNTPIQSITVPANGSINVPIIATFASAGIRTITYSVLYNNQVLDSLSITVQANNPPTITTPPSTTIAPPTSTPTSMSFTVSGGPFGWNHLTSYLIQGQYVNVSFTISGGNNDIKVYVNNPSNVTVAGSTTSRYYNSGQISFTASASGNYTLYFDNRYSPLTSKNIQMTIIGGQWN